MGISKAQMRLRQWFRRHSWHTANTPCNGAWLEMPVDDRKTRIYVEQNGTRYHKQALVGFEVDRFACEYVTVSIYTRRVYEDGVTVQKWPNNPDASFNISVSELKKLAEIAEICKQEVQNEKG